jgi:hypothetical protein
VTSSLKKETHTYPLNLENSVGSTPLSYIYICIYTYNQQKKTTFAIPASSILAIALLASILAIALLASILAIALSLLASILAIPWSIVGTTISPLLVVSDVHAVLRANGSCEVPSVSDVPLTLR